MLLIANAGLIHRTVDDAPRSSARLVAVWLAGVLPTTWSTCRRHQPKRKSAERWAIRVERGPADGLYQRSPSRQSQISGTPFENPSRSLDGVTNSKIRSAAS